MAKVFIDGKAYQSAPIDLVAGVNLVPIVVGERTRYVPVGAPAMVQPYQKGKSGGK